MKKNRLFLAMALASAAGAASAAGPAIDFSGYMRAGVGVNTAGGDQVCFGLAGADTKYRLGNECDYVIEPSFNAKIAEFQGSDWHVHIMPTNTYYGWGDSTGKADDQLITRFGQIYTYGDHVAALGNGKIWAGRRFYNRLQTGINDQFLENNDGNGAGIEDIDLGFGKLSAAFMMDPNGGTITDPVTGARSYDPNSNRYAIPLRITGIKDVPNGDLSVYVTGTAQTKSKNQLTGVEAAEEAKGGAIGVYQTFNGLILNGKSLFGAKFDKQGETKNTRVIFQQSSDFGATSVDFITEYRINKQANNSGNKWFTIGARADTYISGPFRFLVEAGHDQVKADSNSTLALNAGGQTKLNMTKLTAAVAASAGTTAGSRPTVRLFVTHAVWNDAAKANLGGNTAKVFGDKKAGTSVGIQGEAWW